MKGKVGVLRGKACHCRFQDRSGNNQIIKTRVEGMCKEEEEETQGRKRKEKEKD